MHVITQPGRLSVPDVRACIEFAVSRLRSQFARLAKDTAIVGLPLNRGAGQCLQNGECSLPRGVTIVRGLAPHGQTATSSIENQQPLDRHSIYEARAVAIGLAFCFTAAISVFAAGPEECGFCPVISSPLLTT